MYLHSCRSTAETVTDAATAITTTTTVASAPDPELTELKGKVSSAAFQMLALGTSPCMHCRPNPTHCVGAKTTAMQYLRTY